MGARSYNQHWLLFDLCVRTPRLELRLATDEDISCLAHLTDDIYDRDSDATPPLGDWVDIPAPRRYQETAQYFWKYRAGWTPENWNLACAVLVGGVVIGMQSIGATEFSIRKVVNTGSWLGRVFQGNGIGKEMRAAILHLAFEGLGAIEARSGAVHDNLASLGVSKSLGYVENGNEIASFRGQPVRVVRLRLDRETWLEHRRDDIVIEGLDTCLKMFGVIPMNTNETPDTR